MTGRERYGITAAVWVGSLVLVGLPTMALVSAGVRASLSATPLPQSPVLALGIGVLAVAVGLTVATELTRVRLHGLQELHRRSRTRVLVRHAILAVPALLFLGVAGSFVVGEIVAETDGFTDPVGVAAFAVVSLVFAYSVVRTVRSFVAGRNETLAVWRDAPGEE